MVLRWARTRPAVLAGMPLEQLALSLLAPKQILAVSLPAFVDDWLSCIARRWQTTESTTAAWLLAEGAGYLYALENKGHTDWRTGPNRWVIPEGPTGPQRLIEMPGESLQTTVGWLASRRGDDQTGIVTLAIAVGARMWLDDHGCACGPHHTPGAGREPRPSIDAGAWGPAAAASAPVATAPIPSQAVTTTRPGLTTAAAGPGQRPLAESRRPRVRHPGMGRLVQQPATPPPQHRTRPASRSRRPPLPSTTLRPPG